MRNMSPESSEGPKGEEPWRAGRKVGRTIYDAHDNLIGVMDTPEMASAVVAAMAEVRRRLWCE